MTDRGDRPGRRVALVLLALAAAGGAWEVAAEVGPVLGSEAFWPLDRIGLVLAVLAGVERLVGRG